MSRKGTPQSRVEHLERPKYCKRILREKEPCKCYYCYTKANSKTKLRKLWREQNPELAAEKKKKLMSEIDKRRAKNLTDSYVRGVLVNQLGVKAADVPDELIQKKRERILLLRMAKQLKKAAHESSKNPD